MQAHLEFLFGDANLSRDAYLRSCMDSTGKVPVATLARFRKVKAKAEGSSVMDAVVAGARACPSLVVSGDGTAVGRADGTTHPAVAPDAGARTLVVSRMPLEWDMDDLRQVFESVGLTVLLVKWPPGAVRGTHADHAFVELSAAADVSAACDLLDGWVPPTLAVPRGIAVVPRAAWASSRRAAHRRHTRLQPLPPTAAGSACVLLSGVAAEVDSDLLRDTLEMTGVVRYVDCSRGATLTRNGFRIPPHAAVARFATSVEATRCVSTLAARQVFMGGMRLQGRLLSGEEDRQYMAFVEAARTELGRAAHGLPATPGSGRRRDERYFEDVPPPRSGGRQHSAGRLPQKPQSSARRRSVGAPPRLPPPPKATARRRSTGNGRATSPAGVPDAQPASLVARPKPGKRGRSLGKSPKTRRGGRQVAAAKAATKAPAAVKATKEGPAAAAPPPPAPDAPSPPALDAPPPKVSAALKPARATRSSKRAAASTPAPDAAAPAPPPTRASRRRAAASPSQPEPKPKPASKKRVPAAPKEPLRRSKRLRS